jgi:hypothetical protein
MYAPLDISSVLSTAELRQLRVSAIDVGVIGVASDMYLVLRDAQTTHQGPTALAE